MDKLTGSLPGPNTTPPSNNNTKILVLNGPNLNLLGSREPEIYGYDTLEAISTRLAEKAGAAGVDLEFAQSNSEAELIEWVQRAKLAEVGFIIINPGAYTHTSRAIPDALSAVNIPFLEVHLSNIFAREEFRRHSCFSETAKGVIAGLGARGYELAVDFVLTHLKARHGPA